MRSRGLSIRGAAIGVGMRRRRFAGFGVPALALVVAATWLLWAAPALAHTDLVETRPGDGDVLVDPVDRIELEFSGAISDTGTSIRVLDAEGEEVPATAMLISEQLIVIEPERTLDGSRFAVVWSVRSDSDGHELSGSFTFEVATAESSGGPVGDPDAQPAPQSVDPAEATSTVDEPASETTDGPAPVAAGAADEDGSVADLLAWSGRWVAMVGAMLGIGAIGFAATALVGTAPEVRRAASWIRLGGILVIVGSAVELTALATSHGHSLASAMMPWTWIDILPSAQAYAMVLRIAGGMAMLQSPRLVLTSPGPPISDPLRNQPIAAHDEARGSTVAAIAPADTATNRLDIQHEWVPIAGAALVIVSFGLDGHTARAGLVGQFASMAHVLAAGIWAGGLVVIADLLMRRHRSSKPTDAAAVTVRFSRVASAALVLTAVAGGVLAWSLVDEPSELWSGAWGRTLGVKLILVAAAAAIGTYNHFRVVPHLDQPENDEASTLRRTVAVEALLVLAVLAVTAVLVTAAP